jgi:hypothetical protein
VYLCIKVLNESAAWIESEGHVEHDVSDLSASSGGMIEEWTAVDGVTPLAVSERKSNTPYPDMILSFRISM